MSNLLLTPLKPLKALHALLISIPIIEQTEIAASALYTLYFPGTDKLTVNS